MPRRLKKPTNVPEARQPLVEMLWRFYDAADRPSMRRIAEVIESMDEEQRNGSANHETIRRTLQGQSEGQWLTAEVIFLALCELADVDPNDKEGDDGDRWNPPVAHMRTFAAGGTKRWIYRLCLISQEHGQRAEREAAEAAELEARNATAQPGYPDEPPF